MSEKEMLEFLIVKLLKELSFDVDIACMFVKKNTRILLEGSVEVPKTRTNIVMEAKEAITGQL